LGEFLDFIYHDFKYKLYVPGEYNSDKESPLLVMLHGCGQNPDDFAAGTNMNTLAEKEKFLVLYPDMNHLLNPSDLAGYNPFGCWNWFLDKNQHRGKGHPKLIYEIINEVKSKYKIDSNKVYAAGLSAGGSLACILGVTYPDVFNSIGICSGLAYDAANVFFLTDPMAEEAKKSMEKGVPDPYACGNSAFQEMGEYKKKIRVIVFHGICDTTVHPINGQQVITQWAQTNFLVEGGKGLADVTPSLVKSDIINGKSYTQHLYNDGDGEPLLELWMIDKMGHTWSGGSLTGSYTDPSGPNATEIIWNFLSQPQQQPEEEQIETPGNTHVQLPVNKLVPSPDNQPVETPTELAEESAEELPIESPKKNFFSQLLSKLWKKKK
jgi:poly(hydroxyalkanoate) depolymerase family esterase